MKITPEQEDTAIRARATAAEEKRRTDEVMLLIEALAAGLFVLREAQRDAAEATDAHLRALGIDPYRSNKPHSSLNLTPFRSTERGNCLVDHVRDVLTHGVGPYPCTECVEPTKRIWGNPPLLAVAEVVGGELEPTPLKPRVVVEGELFFKPSANKMGGSFTPSPLDAEMGERIIPIALFDRCVAAAKGEAR